jgi:hypothetical protein
MGAFAAASASHRLSGDLQPLNMAYDEFDRDARCTYGVA